LNFIFYFREREESSERGGREVRKERERRELDEREIFRRGWKKSTREKKELTVASFGTNLVASEGVRISNFISLFEIIQ